MTNDVPDPEAWGIERGYSDYADVWHDAPEATIDQLLKAMGATTRTPPGAGDDSHVLVVHPGRRQAVAGEWFLRLEDGAELRGAGALPADLPLGYHRLWHERAQDVALIVAPEACPSVQGVRQWGWALQLYALRSEKSWGIGDLGDLSAFADIARDGGAHFALLNPLHASLPGVPQQSSPYFPSSREFRNPLFLDVSAIPGADVAKVEFDELAAQAYGLNGDRQIDRDAVWRLKEDLLERIWRSGTDLNGMDQYVGRHGNALRLYATFCAISERHGRPWLEWPQELRHPSSPEVARFGLQHDDRVRFHMWLQWRIDEQLAAAGAKIDLVQDLAIGVDPAGADAWLWQDALVLDARVGAPPDEFNRSGQDWGLPPFHPWRLREMGYEPFIRTVRAGLQHGAGLRIDHVMGLFRLYWVPSDSGPADGTYVRYRWDEMLAIVALESHRAGAHMIGEDLGTIEPYMREELHRRNILSYRLLWFEKDPPATFPDRAMAAVTTHDLPTIAGLWTGEDLAHQRQLQLDANEESTNEIHQRVSRWFDLDGDADSADVALAAHAALAESPSAMVTATVDDALGVWERPNVPGTTDERPNWSLGLPVTVEDLKRHRGFSANSAVLAAKRPLLDNVGDNGA